VVCTSGPACLLGLSLTACCCPAGWRLRCRRQAYSQAKVDEVLRLSNQLALLKKQLEEHQQEAAVQEARKDYSLQVGCRGWRSAAGWCWSQGRMLRGEKQGRSMCRQPSVRMAHLLLTGPSPLPLIACR
jgi:hypothetical protein